MGTGGKGLGQHKAGGPNSSPALQTPASPCTLTHTHTHPHNPPRDSPGLGGTGYIQHSPSWGARRIWAGPGTHSNPEPKQPHSSVEAGAGRGRRGRDWGQAGRTQGEARGGRVPAQVHIGELEGSDADGVNGNAPGWEGKPAQERRTAGGESHFGEPGERQRPHTHPSVVPARPCHPRPQRR